MLDHLFLLKLMESLMAILLKLNDHFLHELPDLAYDSFYSIISFMYEDEAIYLTFSYIYLYFILKIIFLNKYTIIL